MIITLAKIGKMKRKIYINIKNIIINSIFGYIFYFKVVGGTLDLYGNESDYFLILLRPYLTSTITTTCCLKTCPLQVNSVLSTSVTLSQPSKLTSSIFLDALEDCQHPPDSQCGRNFLTSQQKKSLSMRMWLSMNMDMQTPSGIAQGWGLAAIMLCWTFLVFSVYLLSRGGNLKLSNTPQSIFLFGKCFTLYGVTLWKWGSLHLPFIIIISDTCMMVWMHKSDLDCYSYNFVFYFGIW